MRWLSGSARLLKQHLPATPYWDLSELSHDFLMPVLRVFDPLGIYVGKLKPDRRRWSIARRICKDLDPNLLAERLSNWRIRDFQTVAGLLYFLFRCAPKKYDSVVARLDWAKLDVEIIKYLSNPSHETVAILCSLSLTDTTRSLVSEFIALRADSILAMPPRLFLLAPRTGIKHLEAGKQLRLAESNHVEWDSGGAALALIAEDRLELVSFGCEAVH